MKDQVLTRPHEDIVRELDALCQRRAAVYPVRDAVHAELSARLVDYCHWLQERQPDDWLPDPERVERAEALTSLLVGGFFKSGTTLVLNLLDGHPTISALPGDAKLLRFADQTAPLPPAGRDQALREHWIHKLVNPTGLPPFWLFGRDEAPYLAFLNYLDYWLGKDGHPQRRLLGAVAYAFHSANPIRPPRARYWVDKTPTQEHDADRWLSLYPGARFIHVIRNPLAALAAMKTMAVARGQPFSMADHADQMHASMQLGLSHRERLGESRYVIVRYEDILADPPAAMRAVADRLDIAYDDALVEPTVNGMPGTPNSAYRDSRRQGQIQTRSLERWRERLTPSEVALIVDALYDAAEAYGYDWRALRPGGFTRTRARVARSLAANVFHPLSRFTARVRQAVSRRLSRRSR
jgi:hypothetical protein